MLRLEGKTAIVTGGAHGIGHAIAERFAEEGARVFIADVDKSAGAAVAKQINKRGGDAVFVFCDVSKAARVGRSSSRHPGAGE
jgi:3-oxoacyl-[acyl-carrier protein] reductase